MNRKQGQSQRMQGTQSSSMSGNRAGQQMNQRGFSHDGIDNNFDLSGSRLPRSQRGMISSDDTYETGRGYRDTDYDLDGSTYGDFDSNDKARFSQARDEDRFSNRSSYNSSFDRYAGSQGDRGLNRQASSSERFGYPSNMNAWSGGGTPERMGQSSWASQDSDSEMSSFDNSVGNNDWGSSQSYGSHTSPSSMSASSTHTQRGHFGKGPKGYKRSDDRIKEEVCETLSRNPRIDASDIEVEVSDAMVTLSGTVESRDIRRAAEMAIENLSGVDDVKNEIRVKKSDSMSTSSSMPKVPKTDSPSSKGSSRM